MLNEFFVGSDTFLEPVTNTSWVLTDEEIAPFLLSPLVPPTPHSLRPCPPSPSIGLCTQDGSPGWCHPVQSPWARRSRAVVGWCWLGLRPQPDLPHTPTHVSHRAPHTAPRPDLESSRHWAPFPVLLLPEPSCLGTFPPALERGLRLVELLLASASIPLLPVLLQKVSCVHPCALTGSFFSLF